MTDKYRKSGHSAPELETVKLDIEMAISINPSKSWDGVPAHLLPFINHQLDDINQILYDTSIVLCPEFSPIGRVHFHGWITPKSHLGYLTTLYGLANIGTYCVKQMMEPKKQDPEDSESEETESEYLTWDMYCLKQKDIIKPLFESSRYSYPIRMNPPERTVNVKLPTGYLK